MYKKTDDIYFLGWPRDGEFLNMCLFLGKIILAPFFIFTAIIGLIAGLGL